MIRFNVLFVFSLLQVVLNPLNADELRIAVASNFYGPAKQLAKNFEAQSGAKVQLSAGSTGALYAQLKNGAPFDLFLSADQKRPALLFKEGLAETPVTYALGQLVLWSASGSDSADSTELNAESLRDYSKLLAMANPKTAPYGEAAEQVLTELALLTKYQSQRVLGKNLSQTLQYVVSGNAPIGFVARSQVLHKGGATWLVPLELYQPIRQDAVVIKAASNKKAAAEFLAFLQSQDSRITIGQLGYLLPNLDSK